MFRRRLSFCGRKIIREYFTGKSGAFHGFFSYVGESRIIKTPINLTMRAAVWFQPDVQKFFTNQVKPGGLVSTKLYYTMFKRVEPYIEVT